LLASRIHEPITLDGQLDEAAWANADSTASSWTQVQPYPGEPFSEPTVMRVLYDDENLYVGAELYDSEPQRLTVPGIEQDYNTTDSDMFGVALDTFLDHQNAFLFAINPEGAVFDAQAFNDQQSVNRSWEGVIHVQTRRHERGWTAELAIPFSTLRYDPNLETQVWGINFSRRIRRRNEDAYWAPLPRQFRIYKMSQAGTLRGLEHLPRNRNLGLKPYLAGRSVGGRAETGLPYATTQEADIGLDVKYGVTSQLTLDLTVNTDFSQAEVDAQQVNLTRFSLFFPEQRDFFLENEGIFAFGDNSVRNYRLGSSPRSFRLFHSRRIGLSTNREPIPIAAGARLTGRAGAYEIGLLNMQTRRFAEFGGENFGVVRIRRNLLTSADAGLMLLSRQDSNQGNGSYAFGSDANFRFGNLILNSYAARAESPDVSGDPHAAMLQVAWRDPLWDVSTLLKQVGDGFQPDVGFVDRRGIRRVFATVGAHPQPGTRGILEFNPFVDVDLYSDLAWDLETRIVRPGLITTLMDGSTVTVQHDRQFERLRAATPIAGVGVDPGDYDFARTTVGIKTSGGRRVSGELSYEWGDFFDGDRRSTTASLLVLPSYRLSLAVDAQVNALNLGGTRFDANLYSARFRYAQNTRVFLSGSVQYDENAREVLTNLRFNWIHAPLSDVFLVLTERRDIDAHRVLDRLVSLKVTKLLSF